MNDQHPDDEALSAHLDEPGPAGPGGHEQGPAGPGSDQQLRDHLDGCEACTARLTELQRVRVALAEPVPPPPAWQRDAAVARALDAVGHRGGSRHTLGTWVGGIAAALLLVLGAAFGVSQLSSGGGSNAKSARATKSAGQAEASAAGSANTAVSELGNLGPLRDTAALRAVVQPTVAQLAAAPKAARASPGAVEQAGAGDSTSVAARQCVDAARALDSANVSPTAQGIATWQGTPAEVLVYAVAGRPGAARVYVLARADCRVLEFQSYAP